MRRLPLLTGLVVGLVVGLLMVLALAGCTLPGGEEPTGPVTSSSARAEAPRSGGAPEAYDVALSEPEEDSLYPEAGDPGLDSLHYDLTLDWDPAGRVLTGEERLTFRAAAHAPHVRLDLNGTFAVAQVTLDGQPVAFTHTGKDLVVQAPVKAEGEHVLALTYSGTPAPVPAPTTRGDIDSLGLAVTDTGEVWTMQEPFGAYTWYAVNDQPSDKALYDFTITAPSPWVGVANGELVSRDDDGTTTTTRWSLDDPAASYLTTLAVGPLQLTEDEAGDLPITYWTPPDRPGVVRALEITPDALAWVEERLGDYPFDSLGIVVVDSRSGMETQTMITLGDTDYATSPETIVHELVHQWYGDLVTPSDWRDLWMNEGMATYLQGLYSDERLGCEGCSAEEWARREPRDRRESGPPGAYDPLEFGQANVYLGPALMWQAFHQLVGDDTFWRVTREWPQEQAHRSTDRATWVAWLEQETGEELDAFFEEWLMSPRSPVER